MSPRTFARLSLEIVAISSTAGRAAPHFQNGKSSAATGFCALKERRGNRQNETPAAESRRGHFNIRATLLVLRTSWRVAGGVSRARRGLLISARSRVRCARRGRSAVCARAAASRPAAGSSCTARSAALIGWRSTSATCILCHRAGSQTQCQNCRKSGNFAYMHRRLLLGCQSPIRRGASSSF